MTTLTKLCARCGLDLPINQFTAAPRMKSGLKSYCRDCCRLDARERYARDPEHARAVARASAARRRTPTQTRARHIKNKYGLTVDQYDAMLRDQDHRCAICRTDTPGGRGGWHVDHCHETGAVRALLCAGCNVGIAQLRHNPEVLRAAATYLETHQKDQSR